MSFLLLVVVALAASAAASAPSSRGSRDQEASPQPEVTIHFPDTSEVACWRGACSVPGGSCVQFHLADVLGADPECRFLPDNMSLPQRRRLVLMFRDILRPDHRLECATLSFELWSTEDLRSGEFEVVRGRDRRLCRAAADARGRDSAVGLGRPLQPKSPFDVSESDRHKRLRDRLHQLQGPYDTSVHKRLPDDFFRPIDWSDFSPPENSRFKIKNPWRRPVRIRPPPLRTGLRIG